MAAAGNRSGFHIGPAIDFRCPAPQTDKDDMTDAAAISQFSQARLAADVNIKLAVKVKDVAEQQGAAVLSLLESAATLSQSMTHESGKGQQLDVTG